MKPKQVLQKEKIDYPNMTEEHLGKVNEEFIRRSSLAIWKFFEENEVPIKKYLDSQEDIVKCLYQEHGEELSNIVNDRHINPEQFDTASRLAAKLYYEGYDEVIQKFEKLDFPGVGVTKWKPTIEKYEPTDKEIEKDQERLNKKARKNNKHDRN